jgi:uroporphyrin-III C-methyltransferase/precorrin-2 dehydrogenase/sirohydrochlorin ferrochelatase
MPAFNNKPHSNAGGSVTLVGAGPGNPELLTLRAVRALQEADVILIDNLVAPAILDFARREAKKMMVGKTGYGPSCRQDEINAMMISLAKSGKRVVRLKGGDPMIFGRAGEEIAACRAAGIPARSCRASRLASRRFGSVSRSRARAARRVQYITAHGANGRLPPTSTASALIRRPIPCSCPSARWRSLQPRPGAWDRPGHAGIAVASATRLDEQVVNATIATIAAKLADAAPMAPR